MENENVEINALALMTAEVPSEVSAEAQADIVAATQRGGFIPNLTIAYGTSKICLEQRKAQAGDFVLGGQTNLSQSTEAVYLFHRFRATEWDGDEETFKDTCYHIPYDERGIPNKPIRDNKEYVALVNKYGPTGKSGKKVVHNGMELLVYIPDQKAFALFYCKSTLSSAADGMLHAGRGRLCSLTTKFVQGKKANSKWFEVIVTPLAHAVKGMVVQGVTSDIDLPIDLLNKSVKMFLSPKNGVIEDDTGATDRDR